MIIDWYQGSRFDVQVCILVQNNLVHVYLRCHFCCSFRIVQNQTNTYIYMYRVTGKCSYDLAPIFLIKRLRQWYFLYYKDFTFMTVYMIILCRFVHYRIVFLSIRINLVFGFHWLGFLCIDTKRSFECQKSLLCCTVLSAAAW